MANALKHRADRPDHDPPLADWLVALSHDSPYERPEPSAVRTGLANCYFVGSKSSASSSPTCSAACRCSTAV